MHCKLLRGGGGTLMLTKDWRTLKLADFGMSKVA